MNHGNERQAKDPSGSPAGRYSSWLERHSRTVLILLVVGVFIFLDLILAPFYAERIPNIKNTYYHHGFVANYDGVMVWGSTSYPIHTDSLGLKDRASREVKLKNDRYRLVFIGDSFTEGVGFPYEETFVGLIDQQLSTSGYEVLNAAGSSYSPKLYYLKTKYLLEKAGLQFNELVVFIDISDLQDELEYEDFQPSSSLLLASLNRLNYLVKRYSFVSNFALREIIRLKREVLIRNINIEVPRQNKKNENGGDSTKDNNLWKDYMGYWNERSAWTYDEIIYKKWGEKGFALAADYMDKLYNLCRDHQIKLTIVVYPWPSEIEHRNYNSKNVLLWKDFCQKRDISFLNCYPYFFRHDNSEKTIERYYGTGDFHFNRQGHQLIAKAWLDYFNTINPTKP